MHNTQRKIYQGIRVFDKALYSLEVGVSLVCLIVMIGVVLYGIVMRFLLRLPNPYGEELSRYLMIYFVYLGISLNVRFHGHLAVEMIVNYFPAKGQKICKMISDLISIVAYGIFTYLAWALIKNMLDIVQYSTQMHIPMWIVYISMFLGFFFSTIRSILLFWNDHCTKNKIFTTSENIEGNA